MAGQDDAPDPAKALEFKEKGNRCFQTGDWKGAEALYTKAIEADPTNPLLYTNRSMALLKLHEYSQVILDSRHAISILPHNMKAFYHLAQAQIALHETESALENAKKAYEFCVEDVHTGGKGASSLGAIGELVARCRKEDWERREEERLKARGGLCEELVEGLRARMGEEVKALREAGREEEVDAVEKRFREKIDETRAVFVEAGKVDREGMRREVPDWCVDGITFLVMQDPVVTKTGQSYERSSIMEHLKRSHTDPLTREPLKEEDLRPNLGLRDACEEFLHDNGWAVDY